MLNIILKGKGLIKCGKKWTPQKGAKKHGQIQKMT